MEINITKKRTYELSDAPADLSGFFVPIDNLDSHAASRIDIVRLVASQLGEVINFDHHLHIVTPEEAAGGDFTFEVPNIIEPTMSVHVFCNQLPLTFNKGYYIRGVNSDNNGVGTRQITIRKNNANETYFPIKAGWPIFVGYCYKIAIPGAIPESIVTLDSITHLAPNSANNVKFILHFGNTGSASESVNLRLTLIHSGSGGVVSEQKITHSVAAGGNTYEVTYLALGDTSGTNTYTLYVTGDKTGNNAVTVPQKASNISLELVSAERDSTTTIQGFVKATNGGSLIGNYTGFYQLDIGTKFPLVFNNVLEGGELQLGFNFTGVSTSAHTITLYAENETTVIDTISISAISNTIISYSNFKSRYVSKQTILNNYSGGALVQGNMFFYPKIVSYNFSDIIIPIRIGIRVVIPTNLTGITQLKLRIRFKDQASYRNPFSAYVSSIVYENLSLFQSLVDINAASMSDVYENLGATELTNSITVLYNDVTLILNSSAFPLFENNANGYVDLILKATIENSFEYISLIRDLSEQLEYYGYKLEITQ